MTTYKVWLDCETTGISQYTYDIVQLAAIVKIDNVVQANMFNEYCQTITGNIDPRALAVNGILEKSIKTFQHPQQMWTKFFTWLDGFAATDQFVISGYNVEFDQKHIRQAFVKLQHDKAYDKYFKPFVYDVFKIVKENKAKIQSENHKLTTVCKYFNIPLNNAHNALADIEATILLDDKLKEFLQKDKPVSKLVINDIISSREFKEPVQLHIHSKYSLLDAIPSPKEWYTWAIENKVPGLAITDHGTAISFFDASRYKNILKDYNDKNKTSLTQDDFVAIPGVELYVKMEKEDKKHHHLIAWAISTQGYYNLMKLSSIAFEDSVKFFGSTKGRITFDQISQYREGIKFGSACIASPIGSAFMDGDLAKAEELFKYYVDFFKDDLYIEFHPSDITHDFDYKLSTYVPLPQTEYNPTGNIGEAFNIFLLDMVLKYNCKAIPTTDAHFIHKEDKILQDILLKNSSSTGWCMFDSYHAKKAKEIYSTLKRHLKDRLTEDMFEQWINNTYEIAELAKTIDIKYEYRLPTFEIPERIQKRTSDYNMQLFFLMMDKIKQHGRWKEDPIYIERFKKEVDVIMKNKTLNFIPYFLIYEDIGTFCRDNHILQGLGRGSAGGSLISFYLKIINMDPIQNDLPFERFLSHARINASSFPDIDQDIGKREPVLAYLAKKYGLGFAQISTHMTMKTKVALKDIMKAIYGRSANDPEVKEICTHIPDSPQGISEKDFLYGYVDSEGVRQEGLIEQSKELQSFFSRYKDVEKMVKRLIGLVRQTGRHASGFVISTLDLAHSCVPTMIANDPILGPIQITQYDAPMCEKCGLVKADILGLNTLNVISDCLSLIKDGTKNYLAEDKNGIQQLYRLPEDQLIYKDFFDKNTDSSFQFNTSLIKTYITKFNPTERKHLSDLTALCRPGTLDAPLDISAIYRIEYDCGEIEYITEDEYNRRGLNENN